MQGMWFAARDGRYERFNTLHSVRDPSLHYSVPLALPVRRVPLAAASAVRWLGVPIVCGWYTMHFIDFPPLPLGEGRGEGSTPMTKAPSPCPLPKGEGSEAGYTLVELLVVIAVIGVLVSLLLPAVQAAREAARQAECRNHLRQIGVALHAYHDGHRQLPIGCIEKRVPRTHPNGRQLGWLAETLPHLEEQSLWQQIDFNRAYDGSANAAAAATVVGVFLCPSTVRLAAGREGAYVASTKPNDTYRAAASDYGGIYGAAQTSPAANGVLLYDIAVKFREITDGTSHTLAVAEDTGRGWTQDGEWINGENIFDVSNPINTQRHNEIWSDHPGGAMALWCDGGVALLSETIDLVVLRAMCTRAGNDISVDNR